jgi:hypothetical protein
MAFEGFRVIARSPGSLVAWWATLIVGLCAFMLPASWTMSSGAAGLAPIVIALVAYLIVVGGLLTAAIYRAVLTPEAKSFAYLRLGGDEARMMLFFGMFAAAIALVSWLASALRFPLAIVPVGVILASPLALIGPSIFVERRISFGTALRLARKWLRELVVVNLIVWLMFAGGHLATLALWRLFTSTHTDVIARSFNNEQDFRVFAAAALVSMLPYAALLVIVTAPAAAAYRFATTRAPAA